MYFKKLNSTRSPQYHHHISMVSFLHSLFCCCSISAYSFQDYLSMYGQLAGEISLQLGLNRFPSVGPLANGNKSNAKKSRFRPNRNLTGTIYHWSVILRSFSVLSDSAKRDANGVLKVLLQYSTVKYSTVQYSTVKIFQSVNLLPWSCTGD